MSDPIVNPDPFDAQLTGHLRDALDPHVGRAEAAFLDHLQREAASGARRRWSYGWAASLAGTALAASIAVVMVMPLLDGGRATDGRPGDGQPDGRGTPLANAPVPVEELVNYRTIDGGTVVVGDGLPARVLRQQRVHRVRWVDPQTGVRMEMAVPHEDVTFMELDTY